jgi:hypothetical protein
MFSNWLRLQLPSPRPPRRIGPINRITISNEPEIHASLQKVARTCEIAVVVGMPGVGKSLFVQQLALIAQQEGRSVHLLQWDVTRRAFETDDILARYPDLENGETHPLIRMAVGMWSRSGVLQWHREYGDSGHMLIVEAPLVGNRLVEISQPADDEAELVLAGSRSRFILPVPSVEVRREIGRRRAETSLAPRHGREASDAPSNLLDEAWRDLYQIGRSLTLADNHQTFPEFDPDVYEAVFERMLRHRATAVLRINEVLEGKGSVYDLDGIVSEVSANPTEARDIILHLESKFTLNELDTHVDQWHRVE